MDTSEIEGLVTLADYQSRRPHLFPSKTSLEWYTRQHRQQLVDDGALLLIAGRRMANPPKFDDSIMRIGQREAQGAAA